MVDGASQREIGARLLAFNASASMPIAVVTDEDAPLFQGVKQLRGISLIGDAYVVFDHITAASPCTMDRYQYGPGTATLTPSGGKVESLPLLPKPGQFTGIEGGPCGKEARVTFSGTQLKMRVVSDHDLACYKARTVGGYQAQPIEVTWARRQEGVREATLLAGFCEGKDVEPPALQINESRRKTGIHGDRQGPAVPHYGGRSAPAGNRNPATIGSPHDQLRKPGQD